MLYPRDAQSCQTLPGLPRASHVAPLRARAAAKRQHVRGRAAQRLGPGGVEEDVMKILRSRRETSVGREYPYRNLRGVNFVYAA